MLFTILPQNRIVILYYLKIMCTKRVLFPKMLAILVVNIFLTNFIYAQFYSLGSNPARIKWSVIDGDNYRVIFPMGSDSLATEYYFFLNSSRDMVFSSLRANPSKIDVIIHQNNLISNGMVGVAPKRVELFSRVPLYNDFSHNWHRSLIIHELRHVAQVSKFEKGIYNFPYVLFGEQSTAVLTGVFLSRWEMEGDAVIAETELTYSGRGRDPDHLAYYKAAFLNGDFRSWENWTLGSYSRYTPNIYSFGYLYNSYVRTSSMNRNYLSDITDYIAKNFYDIRAKNRAYRLYTNNSKRGNFRDLVPYYTSIWKRELEVRAPFTDIRYITDVEWDNYSSISSLLYTKDSSLFYIYSDFYKTPRVVSYKDSTRLNSITPISNISSNVFYKDSLLIWTEIRPSLRWEMENFSDLYTFDLRTGRRVRKTSKKAYFNISLSDSSIFVIENTLDGKTRVLELNNDDFNTIKSYPKFRDVVFREVLFKNGTLITLASDDNSFYILKWCFANNKWEEQLRVEDVFIKQLAFNSSSNSLYFIADFERVNNIYSYDLDYKIIRKVFNSKYGVNSYTFNIDSGDLIVSDYTHKGYRLGVVKEESLCWDIQPLAGVKKDRIAENLSLEASRDYYLGVEYKVDSVEIRPYKKRNSLFKFHSWAPFYYNIDNIKSMSYESLSEVISPGVVLFSHNPLNTSFTRIGYSYRGRSAAHFNYTYSGLFPVIDLQADYNTRDKYRYSIIRDNDGRRSIIRDTIKGKHFSEIRIMSYLPINLSVRDMNRGLIISGLYKHSADQYYSINKNRYIQYSNLYFGLNYYNVKRLSFRDIFPRSGYGVSSRYSFVPNSPKREFGSLFYLSSYVYTPGFAISHGVKYSLFYQQQFVGNSNYLLSNIISFPIGYADRLSKEASGVKIEYAMPIITKDISWDNVIYIRRVQLNPFLHYVNNKTYSGAKESLFSYGADFIFNCNVFNISFPIDLGIKAGLNRESVPFVQFILNTPL